MIDAAFFGGVFLIIGNYFTVKGDIYNSIKSFLLADIAWLTLAMETGNTFGILSVLVGVVLSFFVFYKMWYGKFHKTITKKGIN